MKAVITIFAALLLNLPARGQAKPVILIAGEGNISIMSTGTAYAGASSSSLVMAGEQRKTVNKHDQTMEMAQDFLESCPTVQTTLDDKSTPDYFASLNREGTPTLFGELGRSQIMVLNAHKNVIFVSKKAKVKNAVKMPAMLLLQTGRRTADLRHRLKVPPSLRPSPLQFRQNQPMML